MVLEKIRTLREKQELRELRLQKISRADYSRRVWITKIHYFRSTIVGISTTLFGDESF